MEQITIGQIFGIFAVLAGAISSIGIIVGVIIKFWKWLNKKEMNPVLDEIAKMEKRIMDEMKSSDTAINEKIDSLKDDIKILDVNQCKDVITSYISALEQNNHIDAIFEERAYEAMDRYTNVLHQNSYIHKRWEEVVDKIKDTKE
ncbi:MAG: hypothetical protein ACI4S3_04240 [Candidatus Gastranaerophilaceae bacterium]